MIIWCASSLTPDIFVLYIHARVKAVIEGWKCINALLWRTQMYDNLSMLSENTDSNFPICL